MAQQALEKIAARGGKGVQMEQRRLGDGSTIRVTAILNFADVPLIRAYIMAPTGEVIETWPVTLPDYDSGAVLAPIITESETRGTIVANMVQTAQGMSRIPEPISERRQAVPLDSLFATLADSQAMGDGTRFSQHRRIRPGNYTGTMRQMIQLLLGIGKLDRDTLEQRLVEAGILRELELSGEDGRAIVDTFGLWEGDFPITVAALYDYRAEKTHGLTFNSAGQCFVIQVGRTGVYAWPLPVDPLSQVQKVRERYALLYPELFREDLSGLSLFDQWGGFPTGEAPPLNPQLPDRVRAGDAIQLLTREQMAPFYSCLPMYTDCGWAFAPYQRAAVNTCWDSENGIKRGHLFTLLWSLDAWIEPPVAPSAGLINLPDRKPWRLRKVRRLSEEQAQQVLALLADRENTQAWLEGFLAAFDAITVVSPGVGVATLNKTRSGWLYHPAWFRGKGDYCFTPTGHPQIKFPETIENFQVSFDFSPYEEHGPAPKLCDAPMWACWVGEQLMIVNYFWSDKGPTPTPAVDTREPCQMFGTWVTSAESTIESLGHFYSNFFDLRRDVITGNTNYSKTSANYAGFADYFAFLAMFGRCAQISRMVFRNREYEHRGNKSADWRTGLAVPFGDRSIIYTAGMTEDRGVTEITGYSHGESIGSTGNTRYGYVFEWVFHWTWAGCGERTIIGDGNCTMVEMFPRPPSSESCLSGYGAPNIPDYTVCEDPFCTSWRKLDCPNYPIIYSGWATDPPIASSGQTITVDDHNRFSWDIRIWGDTHIHGRSISKGTVSGKNFDRWHTPVSDWWWITSPTCDGMRWCRFDVGVNRWGRGLINYHDQVDPMKVLHAGAPDSLYTGPQAVFFGYVSDEVIEYG